MIPVPGSKLTGARFLYPEHLRVLTFKGSPYMTVHTSPVLVMGNKNYSSWSLRPWLALRKAGVHIEEKVLPLGTDEYAREISQWSPTQRVPVLIEGDHTVWDSLAICEYVNEAYAEGSFWPGNIRKRAMARAICAEMHSGFNALRQFMPMNCRAAGRSVAMTTELESDIRRISDIWCECLEDCNGGPWLFGEFTIADAMFAPVVLRFHTYGVPLHGLARAYVEYVLADKDIGAWMNAAAGESEVMAAGEAGL